MAIERINPPDIHQPTAYTHVVRTNGARTAYISGQVAIDPQGNVVGPGDLEAQARQAFANLDGALTALEADFSSVAKMNTTSSITARRRGLRSRPRAKKRSGAEVSPRPAR